MGPLALAGLMGGVGLAKDLLVDQPRAKKERELQAAVAQYSPWTGMKPQTQGLSGPDTVGTVAQGAMQGAAMGQQLEAMDAYKNYMDQAAMNAKMAQGGQAMMSPYPLMGMRTA